MTPVGERALIAAMTEGIESVRNQAGLGDDCAVIGLGATDLVLSVDTFAAPTHFPEGTPPELAGRFATSAALSDLAAAGAEPLGVLVGYGLPPTLDTEGARALARGVRAALESFGGEVLGGDTKPRGFLELAVTAVGTCPPGRAMSRSGAKPDDHLLVSGPLGGAGAALERLDQGLAPADATPLLSPVPRLRAGKALLQTGVRCAMDLSDGLADGASAIAAASGVRIVVEAGNVPLHPWTAGGDKGLAHALDAGGDYELIAAVPATLVAEALRAMRASGAEPAVIGRVEAGEGAVLLDGSGERPLSRGFEHTFG